MCIWMIGSQDVHSATKLTLTMENSVGQYPYNTLTTFASLELTYGDENIPGYECNLQEAICQSPEGSIIMVNITKEVS